MRLLLPVLLLLAGCGAGPSPAAAPAPEPCPPTLAHGDPPPVPQQPADLGRLVPAEAPTEALLCAYGPVPFEQVASQAPVALAGQEALSAGLERLPQDLLLPRLLSGEGRACRAAGGPETRFLLRLTSPQGVTWVATTEDVNSCSLAGNGSFATGRYVGDQVAASYAAGAWVPAPPLQGASPCRQQRPGRAGQEGSLVPGDPVRLQVCEQDATREVSEEVAAQVREVLADPVAQPSGSGASCGGGGGKERSDLELLFSYAAGPPVLVRLSAGCEPDVDNGSLQAQLTPAQEQQLVRLLG